MSNQANSVRCSILKHLHVMAEDVSKLDTRNGVIFICDDGSICEVSLSMKGGEL